jgi:hypothetical protein
MLAPAKASMAGSVASRQYQAGLDGQVRGQGDERAADHPGQGGWPSARQTAS